MSKLIVSFTTFPARVGIIGPMLETLFAQTKQADLIVLWLAKEQFPKGEEELPQFLLDYVAEGKLLLKWCDDLRPHKKYFYTMKEYPDDVVVTVDDDILYPEDMLEKLWKSYEKHPRAVSATRTHVITLSEEGAVLPYEAWLKEVDAYQDTPSRFLVATGCQGVLYPPHIFDERLFDKEAIMATCLNADDLWLKTMELANDVPTVCASDWVPLAYVPESQEVSLWKMNREAGGNDVQLGDILAYMKEKIGTDIWTAKLACAPADDKLSDKETLCRIANKNYGAMQTRYYRQAAKIKKQQTDIKKLKKQLKTAKTSQDATATTTNEKRSKLFGIFKKDGV